MMNFCVPFFQVWRGGFLAKKHLSVQTVGKNTKDTNNFLVFLGHQQERKKLDKWSYMFKGCGKTWIFKVCKIVCWNSPNKNLPKRQIFYISRRCRYIMLACWSVDCLSSFHPISRLVLVPDSTLFMQNSTISLQDLGVMRTTSDSSKSLSSHLYAFTFSVYNKV